MLKVIMTAAISVFALAGAAHAQGDAAKGEKVFAKCKACHQVGPNAKNGVGPIQNDLIGRKAASVPEYKYSQALIDAGAKGMVWDEATLDKYLADPRGFIPGNKMAFVGLKKEDERADVIAYLKTFTKAPQ